jgi:hypothetical protein
MIGDRIADLQISGTRPTHITAFSLSSSPCRECRHFKAKTPREICRHEPDCLLGDIGPKIISNNKNRKKVKAPPRKRCGFPGCNEMTRSKTGYCPACQNTLRYRKSAGWSADRLFDPKTRRNG